MDLTFAGHGLDLAWTRPPDMIKPASVGAIRAGHVVCQARYDAPASFRLETSGFLGAYVRSPVPFTIRVGSASMNGRDEAVVILGSDVVVEAEFTGPLAGEFVSMPPELIADALGRSHARIASAAYGPDEAAPIRRLFMTLRACLSQTEEVDPFVYEALLHALLRLIAIPDATAKRGPRLSMEQGCIIRKMIANGLAAPLTVSGLAAAVGLSTGHFARAFKETFGASPYQYILRERVSVAQKLIANGPYSFESVAKLSGFSNLAQMTRALKAHAGKTARELRAKRAYSKGMQPIDFADESPRQWAMAKEAARITRL